MNNSINEAIFKEWEMDVVHYERVHGGDINNSYSLLLKDGTKLFLKVNDAARYPNMFKREAEGLCILNKNCDLFVPRVIKFCQHTDARQYLLLEWMERGRPIKNFSFEFGKSIAKMHFTTQPFFGFETNNYIGSLVQNNQQQKDWPSFFTNCRVMPLMNILLGHKLIHHTAMKNAVRFCSAIKNIFPAEPPALLHGDFWSGNFMVTSKGIAGIYDPAVYYGHREMDLGMTKLFGGFDESFYDGYNEVYAIEDGWIKRLPYAQLYPLLVHAVLFGGHYINSVMNILKRF